jgi:hypothetical protein
MGPWVVSAEKSGASSLIRKDMVISLHETGYSDVFPQAETPDPPGLFIICYLKNGLSPVGLKVQILSI